MGIQQHDVRTRSGVQGRALSIEVQCVRPLSLACQRSPADLEMIHPVNKVGHHAEISAELVGPWGIMSHINPVGYVIVQLGAIGRMVQ